MDDGSLTGNRHTEPRGAPRPARHDTSASERTPKRHHRSRLMRSSLPWVVTTTAGAIIGALVNSYLEKANPSLTISDIAITNQFNDRFGKHQFVQIPQDDELVHHLEQSEWTKSIRGASGDLDKITKILTDDRDDVNLLLTNIRQFQTVLPDIKNLLYGPRSTFAAEALFDKWEPMYGFIWGAIDGQLLRGTFFSPQSENDSNTQRKAMLRYEERKDQDGEAIYIVSKRGDKHRIVIETTEEDVQDGKKLAESLEYFDQKALLKFIDAAETELTTYELHAQMEKEIVQYLKGYSRWAVAAFISNSGSSPISFSPNSTLYCNTKGTSLGDGYTTIDLQTRQANGDLDPITVAGGGTKAVNFVSVSLIMAHPNWRPLLDLYASSSRNCFIALHAASGRWLVRSELFSPLVTFGPSSRGQLLTEKEVARRFGE